MSDSRLRKAGFGVAVSVTSFVLLVWLVVAALDEPLSEAWIFPAVFVGVTFVIKGYFIRKNG